MKIKVDTKTTLSFKIGHDTTVEYQNPIIWEDPVEAAMPVPDDKAVIRITQQYPGDIGSTLLSISDEHVQPFIDAVVAIKSVIDSQK